MKILARLLGILLALAVIAAAVLTVYVPNDLTYWRLSIVALEYGHWIAAAGVLALLGASFGKKFRWFRAGILCLAIYLLSVPVLEAWHSQSQWKSELEGGLQLVPERAPILDFRRLWLGRGWREVTPERHWFETADKTKLPYDFYPPQTGAKPVPWVLVIHGGGWDSGDPTQLSDLNSWLAYRGYGVVSVTYRFAPGARWPAQNEDIKSAVRDIFKQSAAMGIDTERWIVLGRSAGGQLAEMLAYADHPKGLRGVVALYTPTDLDFGYRISADHDILESHQLLINYLGGTPDQAAQVYHDSSPINFVQSSSLPTLMIHGLQDPLVWYEHGRRLARALRLAGVPYAKLELPWATHGFDLNLNGPGGQLSTYAIERFAERLLKK